MQLAEITLQLCLNLVILQEKYFPIQQKTDLIFLLFSALTLSSISSYLYHSEAFRFFRERIKHLHLYCAAFPLNSRIYDSVSYLQIANYLQMFTSESLLRTTEQGQLMVFDVSRYFKSSF